MRSRYFDHDFFKNESRFVFTDALCKLMNGLIPNYTEKSSYSPINKLSFSYMDNIEVVNKYGDIELFEKLYPAICLFIKHVELPEEFIEKHNVKPHHISLMRICYFDCDYIYQSHRFYEIFLYDKKPYGNSDILMDIANIYFYYNDSSIEYNGNLYDYFNTNIETNKIIGDYLNKNHKFFYNIMHETNLIILNALKEVNFSEMIFVKDDLYVSSTSTPPNIRNWKLCDSVIRNQKIDKLLK